MKKISRSLLLAGGFILSIISLIGCVKQLPLTPEGARVVYIGVDLADKLPGKPLDKCKIIQHLTLQTDNPYAPNGCWPAHNFESLLRNKTAEVGGNCAVFVNLLNLQTDFFTKLPCWTGVQGMALLCDDATLSAAGFKK